MLINRMMHNVHVLRIQNLKNTEVFIRSQLLLCFI